jgi:hypothetical protein
MGVVVGVGQVMDMEDKHPSPTSRSPQALHWIPTTTSLSETFRILTMTTMCMLSSRIPMRSASDLTRRYRCLSHRNEIDRYHIQRL